MRFVHRIVSLFACLILLWMGATGAVVESIDLVKLVRHAPETDLTMQSINDHKFGNNDYAAVTRQDFGAAPLPAGFDYPRAFETLSGALQHAEPGWRPDFVEVRMANGRPIGQAGKVTLEPFALSVAAAVDLASGAPATPVALPSPFPPPFSIRQFIMELHRLWISHDTPGGWFELGTGILLWVLIVTGLVIYFRLLGLRGSLRQLRAWFWAGGDWWRVLHRWISVVAAVVLIVVAGTGTYLGFETAWHGLQPPRRSGAAAPLSAPQITAMARATAAILQRDAPTTPVRVVRLRVYAGMGQGVVLTGEPRMRQLVYDLATGKPQSLNAPGYPASGFPFGMQAHETMRRIHSGELFGAPAVFLTDLAGISLAFLSVSGVVVYVSMWSRRARAGRRDLIW
ncbi:MAG TPA: PepSY-associated TM helix domain-containing protein [Caulobacteraceae bacterium]|nr:PepSY-associated TM helix domain-containing protein [Caulobacteraceae bacterium]